MFGEGRQSRAIQVRESGDAGVGKRHGSSSVLRDTGSTACYPIIGPRGYKDGAFPGVQQKTGSDASGYAVHSEDLTFNVQGDPGDGDTVGSSGVLRDTDSPACYPIIGPRG